MSPQIYVGGGGRAKSYNRQINVSNKEYINFGSSYERLYTQRKVTRGKSMSQERSISILVVVRKDCTHNLIALQTLIGVPEEMSERIPGLF